MNRKGQIAIYVIVAVVVVGLIIAFVAFRGNFGIGGYPKELAPVFDYYHSCLERESKNALEIMGSQGGRIDTGAYVPGSDYAPFGSHLSYLGYGLPYWYSVEGNGLVKENVPTLSGMQTEIANYVSQHVKEDCDFSQFYEQGYYIDLSVSGASAILSKDRLDLNVRGKIIVSKGEETASEDNSKISVNTKIGSYYDFARKIYDNEKANAFLEDYAVDVLRNYVPVDGVDVKCSPTTWKTQDVVNNLYDGLEANFAAIKFKGNYYASTDDYFVVNQQTDVPVNIVYSRNWPAKLEITPATNELMIAEPVGNQQGLGILGFCYVPYHFVYDLSVPVVVQIYDGSELFQFPVVVVIDNNVKRNALNGSAYDQSESDICSFRDSNVLVTTNDINLNPIEAHVRYQCFEQTCDLGDTKLRNGKAVLETSLPTCVNGYLVADADNYTESKLLFSSNSENAADLILERTYDLKVNVFVDGKQVDGTAVVHFEGHNGASAVLPDNPYVSLSEGSYNVSVFVYGNSSVTLPASTKTQCTSVAKGGVFGFFGGTKEECFDIEVPASKIDYALRGGGMTSTYILPQELETGSVNLYVSSLPQPNSLEQLQTNFEIFDSMGVEMSFK